MSITWVVSIRWTCCVPTTRDRKAKNWWHRLLYPLLETCLVNSWICFNDMVSSQMDEISFGYAHNNFRFFPNSKTIIWRISKFLLRFSNSNETRRWGGPSKPHHQCQVERSWSSWSNDAPHSVFLGTRAKCHKSSLVLEWGTTFASVQFLYLWGSSIHLWRGKRQVWVVPGDDRPKNGIKTFFKVQKL